MEIVLLACTNGMKIFSQNLLLAIYGFIFFSPLLQIYLHEEKISPYDFTDFVIS